MVLQDIIRAKIAELEVLANHIANNTNEFKRWCEVVDELRALRLKVVS